MLVKFFFLLCLIRGNTVQMKRFGARFGMDEKVRERIIRRRVNRDENCRLRTGS